MSAVATQNNPSGNKNGGCSGSQPNGNDKYPSTTFQGPKKDKNNMTRCGCGGSGHSWRECFTPRQGNSLPFRPNPLNQNPSNRQNLNGQWGGNTTLQSSSSDNQGGIHIDEELGPVGVLNGLEYYNPNPWARILGRANETYVEIDGIISKALIDSGAMISMMSRGYCDEHGYEIQPLDNLVLIEGSGGADIPYLGYVEVRMYILGIHSFDRNVLMLISHTTTHHHQRVPIQVGIHIFDQVTSCISEDELHFLSKSWKLAHVSMIISKSVPVSDLEFDLDQVKGKVVTSEKVKIPTLQPVVVKGLTMVTGHQKCVYVLVEPSPKCTSIFVLGNTSELRPGGSGVAVVLRNLLGGDITLEPHTEIGMVTAANIVPSMQGGNELDLDEKEKVPCMSAQVESTDLPGKFQ